MKYVRREDCPVCHKQMIWDNITKDITCDCGRFRAHFVSKDFWIPIPQKKAI